MIETLASPFVLFAAALAVGYLLYFWARSVAPHPIASPAKLMPYVGGEPFKGQAYMPGYQFFYVALFFTLVHVAALVLATAPAGMLPWAAMAYLGLVSVAVLVLRWR